MTKKKIRHVPTMAMGHCQPSKKIGNMPTVRLGDCFTDQLFLAHHFAGYLPVHRYLEVLWSCVMNQLSTVMTGDKRKQDVLTTGKEFVKITSLNRSCLHSKLKCG